MSAAAPTLHAQEAQQGRVRQDTQPAAQSQRGIQPGIQPEIQPGAKPLSAEQLAGLDVRASQLIDRKVQSPRGESLGEIADLVVDLENSRVRYAVLKFDDTLGLGGKLFAYPIDRLKVSAGREALTLNVRPEELRKAPGFNEKQWPDWSSGSYRGAVDKFFFKTDEAKRAPQSGTLARASDVLGKDVEDRASHGAGELAELVVNLGNGQIRYAVLAFDPSWKLRDKLVALPLNAFQFPSRPDIPIYLNMDRERIAKARPFDKDNWPDLNSPEQRRQIERELAALQSSPPAATSSSGASAVPGSTSVPPSSEGKTN